jgi:membrane protease YdiL (CAAX protease family)
MRFLRDSTPFTQVLFTLIIILVGGILVSMVGFLVCRIGLGISFDDLSGMLANVGDPANVGLLKFFQVLQSLGMFILPPVLIAYSLDDKPFQFLQLSAKPAWKMLGVVCGVILVSGPVIEWVSLLNQQLVLPSWLGSLESWMRSSEDQANEITKAFLTTKSIGGLLGNLFIVAVLPAIGEELLFRGVLQNLIKKMTGSSHWGIWITAILFSALHLQFFGFLPRMLLGALFGYLLEWTGNLWLPMLAHFINNAAGVIIFFVTGEGLEPDKNDVSLFNNPAFFYAIISGVVVWMLLRYIYSKSEQNKTASNPPGLDAL